MGKSALRIFPSKTSIQQQAPHYNLTSSQKEAVERTIHIGGVDVNVTFFLKNNVCSHFGS